MRSRADSFLRGDIDEELAQAIWIISKTYDKFNLQPAELRQLLAKA